MLLAWSVKLFLALCIKSDPFSLSKRRTYLFYGNSQHTYFSGKIKTDRLIRVFIEGCFNFLFMIQDKTAFLLKFCVDVSLSFY